MRKLWIALPVGVVLALVALATSFAFSDRPTTLDIVYEIADDVSLYAVGTGNPQIRYNSTTGKWQRYTLGSWIDITGTPDFSTFLDSYDVATVADVQAAALTVDQLLSSYNTYFGQLPLSYSRIVKGSTQSLNTTFPATYSQLLMAIGQDIQNDLMLPTGKVVLNVRGQEWVTDNNLSIIDVFDAGFLGLNYNMMNYIKPAIMGPGTGYQFTVNGSNNTASSVLAGLELLNRNLTYSQYIATSTQILGPNGTLVDSSYTPLSLIANYGFRGLYSIIHGLSDSDGSYTFLDYSDLSEEQPTSSSSLFSVLVTGVERMQHDFAYYLYSHGTDLDIEIRHNMQEQADEFVDDFTAPGGPGTPTSGQMSDAAGVSKGIKDSFSGSATASDAFSQLSDSGNYGFFSSEVQQDLNPFYGTRSYVDDGYVDYVTPHLQDILGGLGTSW